jgi:hypothetical protein
VLTVGTKTGMRERFVTADAVYGLILYAALIGAVSDEESTAVEVLFVSASSLLIFWGAHVFAGTITTHGEKAALGEAIRHSVRHSSGMLWAAILPSVGLLLGVLHLVSPDDAVSWALLTATVILGLLGYQAFAGRRSPIIVRILGGIGAAVSGTVVIALNIAVH